MGRKLSFQVAIESVSTKGPITAGGFTASSLRAFQKVIDSGHLSQSGESATCVCYTHGFQRDSEASANALEICLATSSAIRAYPSFVKWTSPGATNISEGN